MCMRNRGNFDIGSQNVATASADEEGVLQLVPGLGVSFGNVGDGLQAKLQPFD